MTVSNDDGMVDNDDKRLNWCTRCSVNTDGDNVDAARCDDDGTGGAGVVLDCLSFGGIGILQQ